MAAKAEGIEVQVRDEVYAELLHNWLKKGRSRLGFVVVGEAGQGKSSLINGLLGKEVAEEGDDFEPVTHEVEKYCYDDNGITVTLWDTPGFGMETEAKEEKVLEAMGHECRPVDILLYCVRMDLMRWGKPSDIATIRKMTRVFGKEIWQHCLFVLTFANQMQGIRPAGRDPEQYFSERIWKFEEKAKKTLKQHAGLSDEEAEHIRAVPVGDPHKSDAKSWELPDREDWFLDFWMECTLTIRQSALPSLLQLNRHRITNMDVNSVIESEVYLHPVPAVPLPQETYAPGGDDTSSVEASPMPSLTCSTETPPGVHNRQISLFRILKRQLKEDNSGFKQHIKTFYEERGKQLQGFGHVAGIVEGFFAWIGNKITKK